MIPPARAASDDRSQIRGPAPHDAVAETATGAYSNGPRWRRHSGIENRGGSPESFAQYPNDASVTGQVDDDPEQQDAARSRLLTHLVVCGPRGAAGDDQGHVLRRVQSMPGRHELRRHPQARHLTNAWNYNAPTTFDSTFASPRNSWQHDQPVLRIGGSQHESRPDVGDRIPYRSGCL